MLSFSRPHLNSLDVFSNSFDLLFVGIELASLNSVLTTNEIEKRLAMLTSKVCLLTPCSPDRLICHSCNLKARIALHKIRQSKHSVETYC